MPPSLLGLAVALPQALEVDRAALVRCSGSQRRGAEGCYQCPAFLLRQSPVLLDSALVLNLQLYQLETCTGTLEL